MDKRHKSVSIFSALIFSGIFLTQLGGEFFVPSLRAEGSTPLASMPNPHIDVLDLKGMDILDVLKLISQKTGVNIVATQEVKGKVTVFLRDIEVFEALKIIAEAYGWAYAMDGSIVKVMTAQEFEQKYGYVFGFDVKTQIKQLLFAKAPDVVNLLNQVKSNSGKIIADEKSNTLILMDNLPKIQEMQKIIEQVDVPLETQVFHLSYAKAEEISANITEVLTPTVGVMKFDARSNNVMITDTPKKLKNIAKMVEAFDQKHKEVLIEAKIIQIVLSDEYRMGVDWQAIVRDWHQLSFKSQFSLFGTSADNADKKGRLSVGTLETDDYLALIDSLDTIGTTDILSSPRITAVNNQEAKILIGSTEPYVTTTTTTTSGTTTNAESVQFVEVGVKLHVTPTIHDDDFITMKIKPEVSAVTSKITTSSNNTIPVVETSEAETTVTVKNGVTIVIGGLMKEEKITKVKKVPILGDIPYINFAFRNQSDDKKKSEIVIFLTPTIITGDVPADDPGKYNSSVLLSQSKLDNEVHY